MHAGMRSGKLPGWLLATALFALPAAAAETVTPVDTPAYPAALSGECTGPGCADTLHAEHSITFISRQSFPAGTALLTRAAQDELSRLLVELESFAIIRHIEIIGHADPSGPENYNRWLSGLRAQRVQFHLTQNGVDPRKISLRAAGSGEPLAGAIDPSEHRRIEVRILLQAFL